MTHQRTSTLLSMPLSKTRSRIVIQGVRGAFHEMAARQLFGDGIDIVPATTFNQLVALCSQPSTADAAVMAIENSIAGSILGNYRLLQDAGLHITGECSLRIEQHLLALPGVKLSDLTEVHSHPMALAQCDAFFAGHPHLRLVESDDTAASAQRIAQNNQRTIAAVGSALAAEVYGLQILVPNIETHDTNVTRFLALERRPEVLPVHGNKVSMFCSISHQSGSLSRLLAMLAAQSANLTKIQSVPKPGVPGEYLFFIDFTVANPAILPQTLRLIDIMTTSSRVLGVYKENTAAL
ncbi:MAG: prephenate dehydratase [Saprospiraceae bacterium]|nr:prephenate dehydratase [Saprospiraceae bacterium]